MTIWRTLVVSSTGDSYVAYCGRCAREALDQWTRAVQTGARGVQCQREEVPPPWRPATEHTWESVCVYEMGAGTGAGD